MTVARGLTLVEMWQRDLSALQNAWQGTVIMFDHRIGKLHVLWVVASRTTTIHALGRAW